MGVSAVSISGSSLAVFQSPDVRQSDRRRHHLRLKVAEFGGNGMFEQACLVIIAGIP
jgi:hypothetical protein